ncbi:uncharacterized mitochondrial protein AtMg00810-like [Dioscorea cayenensis subsp. rotundata]|uniref:Uncharacterized mitochondrial protein AtMg00810-like n=1 Tax=Dioscorea cayennensis subsp. rotundata TaxID=55577 RepID=A0AB40AU10_DIOCR|nr:uncharacterized mitochondrial protein AtMg00810-like [Dioscorea cayenensis subsp. rotundata]
MTDLGLLKYFLGLEVKQGDGFVFVSQKKYAEDLLSKAGMLNCKVEPTPMNTNEKLRLEDGSGQANAERYRRLVGSLLYLTHTKLDLMFVVSVVSRYMQRPIVHHLGVVKRILYHVARTLDHGLLYRNSCKLKLTGFSDSDWGGSLDDRKSVSSWVFNLGSAVVAWSSKKQDITAL